MENHMDETMLVDVIIVGGAVAGAALACAFAKYNLNVLVIDRRKDPGSMNRGDGLQPRTLEILEQWGVLQDFQNLPHVKSYGIELHHSFFRTLMKIDLKPLTSSKFNYIMNIPHREIEQGLLDWANKHDHIKIMRGTSVEHLTYNEHCNVNGIVMKSGNEHITCRAKIVIAADGGLSSIRKELNIPAERIVYNHELIVLHMPRPEWFKGDLRTQVHLHRDGAVVLIPLPDQQMRITVVVPLGKSAEWRKFTDEELLKNLIKRVPSLKNVDIKREGEHIYKMVRMHADTYSSKGAALIGDAAHLTHASSGQGMNMAIQDADVLSKLLARHLHNKIELDEALKLYEQVRKPINEDIISRSNFMSSVVFTPNKLAHTGKMFGMFTTRFIPGLRYKISSKIALGIAGANQQETIRLQLSSVIEHT
ncbi:FAD-dependent oxidoreductase [Paenibacillus endoradicis]|uniref:FAD-dependent oxidoreductase n=1 Tax=Paenibacillus endoradicis TaxID=2972487 RepID=UPI0021591991|nr:NAD(P)/FAD-dependent oxidoreductase [Paenibacillus endoradicis]MCR8657749.1 FAD-dependent monooxygenase [Paenibacillus endoradicis]